MSDMSRRWCSSWVLETEGLVGDNRRESPLSMALLLCSGLIRIRSGDSGLSRPRGMLKREARKRRVSC